MMPPSQIRWIVVALLTGFCCQPALVAQDDDQGAHVRTTEPLSPAEELATFTVPDGFEVSLFAAEPQIQKPLNMAFDADGRLWVTGSNMYPFPAGDEQPATDSIRILEDTNSDGAADKVTIFADDLNIPIGLLPWRDGCLVFSIPNILFLQDTDGDDKADKRTVVYGPFDTTRDTHGMNNSFRSGFDGWIYCCHGFSNQSEVTGADGHTVSMTSGNTYRIRPDGKRIENFTHGQVNPFGMTIDANGDVWNSDCHTKPVSLLLPGGYFDSFGKPHDGLGYSPDVMEHLHGSTAIDGLCQYQGNAFPPEYHNDFFVGNVMTSRVHRNSLEQRGSAAFMREEPDFLVSTDPWFRPVDIQVGPDGALYVADFYNRIIGHYEVPLDHPGRDRQRARIWRIAAKTPADGAEISVPKLRGASLEQLIASLKDFRKPIRQHAADQIMFRFADAASVQVNQRFGEALSNREQRDVPQLLWLLFRSGDLIDEHLQTAWEFGTPRTRIHVQRILGERALPADDFELLKAGLRDSDLTVQRAATSAARNLVSVDVAKQVVNGLVTAPPTDVHLRHALKIALKHQLLNDDVANWFADNSPPPQAATALAEALPAVKTEAGAALALKLVAAESLGEASEKTMLDHAIAHSSRVAAAELIVLLQALPADDVVTKSEGWKQLRTRFDDADSIPGFKAFSADLSSQIFRSVDVSKFHWGQYAIDDRAQPVWGTEDRRSAVDDKWHPALSSLPGGESGVGVLRSKAFVVPFEFSFEVCGHLGWPKESPRPLNRIILRDADTGEELRSVLAPRSDKTELVNWSGAGQAGRKAFLEITDGNDDGAYAWIAFARLQPLVADVSRPVCGGVGESLLAAVEILQVKQQAGDSLSEADLAALKKLVKSVAVNGDIRAVAADVLMRHHDLKSLAPTSLLLKYGATPQSAASLIVRSCLTPLDPLPDFQVAEKTKRDVVVLKRIFNGIDNTQRLILAEAAAASPESAQLLLAAMNEGIPSPTLLRDETLAATLSAHGEKFAAQVSALKSQIPPTAANHDELIGRVVERFRLPEGDASAGAAVFRKQCQQCHQRSGEGGKVGPNLDGILTRGPRRFLEDVLYPNRNVDAAFHTTTLQMRSGKVLTGIVRGNLANSTVTLLNNKGEAKKVETREIEDSRTSRASLMPTNLVDQVSEDDLLNLLQWFNAK